MWVNEAELNTSLDERLEQITVELEGDELESELETAERAVTCPR